MNKQFLPYIAGVVIAIILGGSYIWVQQSKQESIERQAQMKIDQENKLKAEAKVEETTRNFRYNNCVADAEDAYWGYVELNGTGKRDDEKGVWAENWVWDKADERKQTAIDNCFKQFKAD